MTPDTVLLFYGEDVAENMKVGDGDLTLQLLPDSGGMVWNELLEQLYIENSDVKGYSAEQKVVSVFEAAKDFDNKASVISFTEALKKTIEVVKDLVAGPV